MPLLMNTAIKAASTSSGVWATGVTTDTVGTTKAVGAVVFIVPSDVDDVIGVTAFTAVCAPT
ncbi:hypothetical protein MMAD_18630 [Mycolicibacterium madagascariense]|uniref:Uncharacterized protein n=1 Tax=Mycolicibacterium madagascariense TaxID=212765 RepID=A0A7I7XEL5_9MYCO|nr:hypothetical protein MMAD_18630 [Mycolicibacterium madagascariense]